MLLACSTPAVLIASSPQDDTLHWVVRSPVPLGSAGLELLPSHKTFMLFASAVSPSMNGLRVTRVGRGSVLQPDGTPVRYFPNSIDFRVTATTIQEGLLPADRDTIHESIEPEEMLSHLRFHLKVYRGLRHSIIRPSLVRMVGVPEKEPFPERVYQLSFDTRNTPVEARCVLEVLSPKGELLARFHLELL
ncbi:MAG TPA: hypothetical protein VF786_14435 [Terriglobales bacterium]